MALFELLSTSVKEFFYFSSSFVSVIGLRAILPKRQAQTEIHPFNELIIGIQQSPKY